MRQLQKDDSQNPRQQFAALLRQAMENAYIPPEEYAEFGIEIARAQHPTRHIPYGDYVVESWAKGTLLPSAYAMTALLETLKIDYGTPNLLLEQLAEAHEDAAIWQDGQKNQPTEINCAHKTARVRAGLSFRDIVDDTAKKGHERYAKKWNARMRTPEGKIVESPASMSYYANGQPDNSPNKFITYAMGQWVPALEPSLRKVHAQQLHENADSIWEQAEREGSLGRMLHAIRARHGESRVLFGRRMAKIVNHDKPFTHSALSYWEDDSNIPCGNHHHHNTLCEPYILAAKIADGAPNALSRAIPAPWFTPEKERAFRALFHRRVAGANEGMFTYCLPSLELSEAPDMRTIDPSLKIMEGNLSRRILYGDVDRRLNR